MIDPIVGHALNKAKDIFPLPKEKWEHDDNVPQCRICETPFQDIRETTKFKIKSCKHHCRMCGRVVCDDCSKSKFAGFGVAAALRKYRVCDSCAKPFHSGLKTLSAVKTLSESYLPSRTGRKLWSLLCRWTCSIWYRLSTSWSKGVSTQGSSGRLPSQRFSSILSVNDRKQTWVRPSTDSSNSYNSNQDTLPVREREQYRSRSVVSVNEVGQTSRKWEQNLDQLTRSNPEEFLFFTLLRLHAKGNLDNR